MLHYVDLSEKVRPLMVAEVQRDIAEGSLYLSLRLSVIGRRDYPALLLEAVKSHDDLWLQMELGRHDRINATEQRRKPKGGYTTARVPITAPETLAEGEFNRFYARGLCCLAIEDGIPELIVYRAKQVENPRYESQAMIGTALNAASLLEDLRTHQGMDTALRLPPGPNSGLSVCLPPQPYRTDSGST